MHPNAIHRHQMLRVIYDDLQIASRVAYNLSNPNQTIESCRLIQYVEDMQDADRDFALICLIRMGYVTGHLYAIEITGAGILAYEAACEQET